MFYYIWCSPIPLCVCNCLLFSFRYVLNFPIYRLISWFIELDVYFLKKERAWKALIICHLLRSYTQKSVLIIQIKICYVPSIENVFLVLNFKRGLMIPVNIVSSGRMLLPICFSIKGSRSFKHA